MNAHVGPLADSGFAQRLLDLAPDAMLGVDASGEIVFANAQAEILFGGGSSDLLGSSVDQLVPDAVRASHAQLREDYLANPHPRPMGLGLHLAARRLDGAEFPAEISLASVATPAGPIVCAAIRDISDRLVLEREHERTRRQADEERRERQRLQSQRLESLGQLAGGVAHDFNNLLAVITNYTAFVQGAIDDALVEADANGFGAARWRAAGDDLAKVRHAADTAARLTRQLLAFARRDGVTPSPLVLDEVVAETAALLERTLGDDVRLRTRLGAPGAVVLVDRGQLEQVLLNLVVNARRAMPDGGTIELTTDVEDDASTGTPGGVRLTIADDGRGMDAATRDRAFEPFFTTRSDDGGTGLGLSMVYGIVVGAGGRLDLDTAPGEGTTVAISLPRADARPAGVASPIASTAGGGLRVLVVDDQPAIGEVVARLLRARGHEVVVAPGGEAALSSPAVREGVDLLVTDVSMPVVSGPELAAAVRARNPDVGVVLMTGFVGDVAAAERIEGAVLVAKPFGEGDLAAAVDAAVSPRPRT